MPSRETSKRICIRCGYDLAGLNGPCPECGLPSERYTERMREVVQRANEIAKETCEGAAHARNPFPFRFMSIQPVHLSLGLLLGPNGVGRHALVATDVSIEALEASLRNICPKMLGSAPAFDAKLPLSRRSSHLAEQIAPKRAHELGHSWVGTEHLLLAILRAAPRAIRRQFAKHGCDEAQIELAVKSNNTAYHPSSSSESESNDAH